jgi:predicted O-methyltransferase YrrM
VTRRESERLADLAQEKTVLEVGAHYGRSTIALASTAKRVFSLDWHQGDGFTKGWGFTAGTYLKNLLRYRVINQVVPIIGRGEDVAPTLTDEFFELVFIDADHAYQAVLENIDLFVPKAKPGAPIAFHDYTIEGCFERQAVDEKFGKPDELIDSLAICHR